MTSPASDTDEWTAERFIEHAQQTIEMMALAYSGGRREAMERSLTAFAAQLRSDWRETARGLPGISDTYIAGAVDDVLSRIRARRQEIEAASAFGRA